MLSIQCQNITKTCLQVLPKPGGQLNKGHFQPGADTFLWRTAAFGGCFTKQKSPGVFVMMSYGGHYRLPPGFRTAADTLKVDENRCHSIVEIRLYPIWQGKFFVENRMTSEKSGQQQYRPGLDQIRGHRTVRIKLKTGPVISHLSHLLKLIDHKQGAHHRINCVLAIRNQLAGQQRECLTGLTA